MRVPEWVAGFLVAVTLSASAMADDESRSDSMSRDEVRTAAITALDAHFEALHDELVVVLRDYFASQSGEDLDEVEAEVKPLRTDFRNFRAGLNDKLSDAQADGDDTVISDIKRVREKVDAALRCLNAISGGIGKVSKMRRSQPEAKLLVPEIAFIVLDEYPASIEACPETTETFADGWALSSD
ncbi:MAG: hypothetical protein AAF563_21820 [Pseudomonadota bacterium]